jgi:acetate CoA/acetoacetate CoA-transferase alpha subunit
MKHALKPEAIAELIQDGSSLMIGGFMGVGTPERIIDAIVERGRKNLMIIANDTAMPGRGIGKLISAGSIHRVIVSHIGLNPETQQKMIAGEIIVDLVPQGTLIEQIRAGGVGLGGVLTSTGICTEVEINKRVIEVNGKSFLLEPPLRADFALISAFQADYVGNLTYTLTAHNFNPIMALAGDIVVAEAESIVPLGMISPDAVKTPGILVDHLVIRPSRNC